MNSGDIDRLTDRGYGGRLLALSLAGAACAMLLTWFMHGLIHSGQQRLDESQRAHLVDFVRLKRDESSLRKQRKPDRPVQSQAPPAPAALQEDTSQAETTLAVSDTALPAGFETDLQIGGLGFDSSDGEYLPIVKIAPIYPQRAQIRGIEGECVVEYTVTTKGSTRDVRVVEEMCTDKIFHQPSIAAAKKFKYKPRIIDGEAVEVHRVRNRFIFAFAELPDEQ